MTGCLLRAEVVHPLGDGAVAALDGGGEGAVDAGEELVVVEGAEHGG